MNAQRNERDTTIEYDKRKEQNENKKEDNFN